MYTDKYIRVFIDVFSVGFCRYLFDCLTFIITSYRLGFGYLYTMAALVLKISNIYI